MDANRTAPITPKSGLLGKKIVKRAALIMSAVLFAWIRCIN